MPTIFITSADYGQNHYTPTPNRLPHTLPADAALEPAPDTVIRVRINKQTHRVVYGGETEGEVTLVCSPRRSNEQENIRV